MNNCILLQMADRGKLSPETRKLTSEGELSPKYKTPPSEAKDFMSYSQEDYLTVTFTIIFVSVKSFQFSSLSEISFPSPLRC